jgi:hypothetical protein
MGQSETLARAGKCGGVPGSSDCDAGKEDSAGPIQLLHHKVYSLRNKHVLQCKKDGPSDVLCERATSERP